MNRKRESERGREEKWKSSKLNRNNFTLPFTGIQRQTTKFLQQQRKKATQLFTRIILQRQNVCEFLHIEMKQKEKQIEKNECTTREYSNH